MNLESATRSSLLGRSALPSGLRRALAAIASCAHLPSLSTEASAKTFTAVRTKRLLHLAIAALGLSYAPLALAAPPVPTLVKRFTPRSTVIGAMAMKPTKGHLYFFEESSNAVLWRSDGTEAGTESVSGPRGTFSAVELNGVGLVIGREPSTSLHRLWRIEPNATTATPIAPDVEPVGPATVVGSRAVFVGRGGRLWATDGTSAGTSFITAPLTGIESTLFFSVGAKTFLLTQDALLTTDGTSAGTTLVKSLPFASGAAVLSGTTVGARYFFFVLENGTFALWTSDGTPAGTHVVRGGFARRANLWSSLGGKAYFTVPSASNTELWTSDGTSNGTRLVPTLPAPEISFRTIETMTSCNGFVYLSGLEAATGTKLYRTDGGAPALFQDFYPTNVNQDTVTDLTCVNDSLFFLVPVEAPSMPGRFWMSDGTVAGTKALAGSWTHEYSTSTGYGAYSYPHAVTAWNGSLYFLGDDGSAGYDLWRIEAPPSKAAPPDPRGKEEHEGKGSEGTGNANGSANGPDEPRASSPPAAPTGGSTSSDASGCAVSMRGSDYRGPTWLGGLSIALGLGAAFARRARSVPRHRSRTHADEAPASR